MTWSDSSWRFACGDVSICGTNLDGLLVHARPDGSLLVSPNVFNLPPNDMFDNSVKYYIDYRYHILSYYDPFVGQSYLDLLSIFFRPSVKDVDVVQRLLHSLVSSRLLYFPEFSSSLSSQSSSSPSSSLSSFYHGGNLPYHKLTFGHLQEPWHRRCHYRVA